MTIKDGRKLLKSITRQDNISGLNNKQSIINKLTQSQQIATRGLATQFNDGLSTLAEYIELMSSEIISQSYAAALIWSNGRTLSQAIIDAVEASIEEQLDRLTTFTNSIRDGTINSIGTILQRSTLYGATTRSVYYGVAAESLSQIGVAKFEENVLFPGDNCRPPGSCEEQTAKGIVPIGTLIPIGSRTCLGNCRCRMKYTDVAGLEVVV